MQYSDPIKSQRTKKTQNRLQRVINQAKSIPKKDLMRTKTVEDPREGITRRYANYISIPRYQFVYYYCDNKEFNSNLLDRRYTQYFLS